VIRGPGPAAARDGPPGSGGALSGRGADATPQPPAALPVALPRSFHARPATVVARALLGTSLICVGKDGPLVGTIVETEAYLGPHDRASHARSGPTERNRVMFGPPGHAYVYRIYGMHWCLNVVTGPDGDAQAVLIRAVMPALGLAVIRRRRGRPADPVARLLAGPGRVCQGFGIDGGDDGRDLTAGDRLWVGASGPGSERDGVVPAHDTASGPRVGVAYAAEPWGTVAYRFGIAGHPALSRPFPGPGGST
jgi:DNA-3-methyladenine glycosylase